MPDQSINIDIDLDKLALPATVVGAGLVMAWWLMGRGEASTLPLSWPVKSRVITSPYGHRHAPAKGASTFHRGIDIRAAVGESVMAPADGVVLKIGNTKAGGNELIVRHTNGWHTGYAHLSRYAVQVGQTIRRGQTIAYSGRTGITNGPHLHLSLSTDKKEMVDPAKYLDRA